MLDIQQKRKLRNVVYSRITISLLFLLVVLVLHSTWRVYQKKLESVSMRDVSERRLIELEARNIELETKIKKLSTTSGIEEEIRSKFSVTNDNENMVIIVKEEGTSSAPVVKKAGFWLKFANLFR